MGLRDKLAQIKEKVKAATEKQPIRVIEYYVIVYKKNGKTRREIAHSYAEMQQKVAMLQAQGVEDIRVMRGQSTARIEISQAQLLKYRLQEAMRQKEIQRRQQLAQMATQRGRKKKRSKSTAPIQVQPQPQQRQTLPDLFGGGSKNLPNLYDFPDLTGSRKKKKDLPKLI